MHPPQVIRNFIANGHYRSPITFSEDALESARRGWERLFSAVHLVREKSRTAPESEAGNSIREVLEQTRTRFVEAMDDDFNMPVALATLYDMTREVFTLLNSGSEVGAGVLAAIDRTYTELGTDVLGVVPAQTVNYQPEREAELIRLLLDLRMRARSQRDFQTADAIRNQLTRLGISLEDRPDNTTFWRVI
jgi:cysteinyl-tRNA synthetase